MSVSLAELHRSIGGVEGRLGSVPVVRHYGDPAAEYRAIRESVGIVERVDLVQVRMWGRDPHRMLNGLITNDLGRLAENRAVYAAILSPKGRMIADARAVLRSAQPVEILVDVPAVASDSVTAHLKRYVPPLYARWEPATTRVVGVYGPAASDVVGQVFGQVPEQAEDTAVVATLDGKTVPILATSFAGGEPGFDVFVEENHLGEVWSRLSAAAGEAGGRPIGFAALEAARIEYGRPRFGVDMTEESMPAEVYPTSHQMERAVSFTKGCYTGQEVVVRIAHRGHPNRYLRGLRFSADEPPSGSKLYRPGEEREVGRVTSNVFSPMLSLVIGLGMVRREIGIGDELALDPAGEPAATVVELPFR